MIKHAHRFQCLCSFSSFSKSDRVWVRGKFFSFLASFIPVPFYRRSSNCSIIFLVPFFRMKHTNENEAFRSVLVREINLSRVRLLNAMICSRSKCVLSIKKPSKARTLDYRPMNYFQSTFNFWHQMTLWFLLAVFFGARELHVMAQNFRYPLNLISGFKKRL